MTITLSWWAIPIAILVVAIIAAYIYHVRNYQPGGYFGDFVTPIVAGTIFIAGAVLAVGLTLGKLFL
jgi:peptidoglycan/LPS O-acetylase OafA/YrhL